MANVMTARRDLLDALVDLKDEASWTLTHVDEAATLLQIVESGEVAAKIRGVVEAAEALRGAIDAVARPDIGAAYPHPKGR